MSEPEFRLLRRFAGYHREMIEAHAIGSCLEPLVRDGDRVIFDLRLEPEVGDLAMIELDDPHSTGLSLSQKFLGRSGDDWIMISNLPPVRLNRNRMIGIAVVHVTNTGAPRRPESDAVDIANAEFVEAARLRYGPAVAESGKALLSRYVLA